MMKTMRWSPMIVIFFCTASSAVQSQEPGAANPGLGLPIMQPAQLHNQEKRRDEDERLKNLRILTQSLSHGLHSPVNCPSPQADLHTPKVVPSEAGAAASEFHFTPASELRFTPPTFTPMMSEGGTSIARGFSRVKGGGTLAGIGGAIAAAFGAIFGRKKNS
jgi:hypothetical protein